MIRQETKSNVGVPKTYVAVVEDRAEEPVEEHESDEDVDLSPPRHHERRPNIRNLGPIEREHAHAEPASHPEKLVDNDIV